VAQQKQMSSFDDDDDRPKAKIAVKKVSAGPAAAPAAAAEAAAAQAAVAARTFEDWAPKDREDRAAFVDTVGSRLLELKDGALYVDLLGALLKKAINSQPPMSLDELERLNKALEDQFKKRQELEKPKSGAAARPTHFNKAMIVDVSVTKVDKMSKDEAIAKLKELGQPATGLFTKSEAQIKDLLKKKMQQMGKTDELFSDATPGTPDTGGRTDHLDDFM
jgi:hypothetical protein